MIALAFFAGIFLTAAVAILIVRGAKAPPCPGAEFHEAPNRIDFRTLHGPMALDDRMRSLSVRKPCIACYGGDFPCVCRRDADFWDIANHEPEAGRVEYRFLGITGLEDD